MPVLELEHVSPFYVRYMFLCDIIWSPFVAMSENFRYSYIHITSYRGNNNASLEMYTPSQH